VRGYKCKCGFATTAQVVRCPRCGKTTTKATWPDKGRVLSFAELGVRPEGSDEDSDLVMVHIDKDGPKIGCWTIQKLAVGDPVVVLEKDNGRYRCEKARRR
jgi:uncharacterized OB-fold protein